MREAELNLAFSFAEVEPQMAKSSCSEDGSRFCAKCPDILLSHIAAAGQLGCEYGGPCFFPLV